MLEGEEPGSFGSGGPCLVRQHDIMHSSSVSTSNASLSASVGVEYVLHSRGGGSRVHNYEVPRGMEVGVRAGVVEVPNQYTNGHGHGHW